LHLRRHGQHFDAGSREGSANWQIATEVGVLVRCCLQKFGTPEPRLCTRMTVFHPSSEICPQGESIHHSCAAAAIIE
jgi:hypothetical protein